MTPLHTIGSALRDAFASIPLIAARLMFVGLLLLTLLWVLTLPREAVVRQERTSGPSENLRWWAALALLIQLAIYVFV